MIPPEHSDEHAVDGDHEKPRQAPEAYVIPRELAQATLEYLASQPYREVFALIRGFEGLEPLGQINEEAAPKP